MTPLFGKLTPHNSIWIIKTAQNRSFGEFKTASEMHSPPEIHQELESREEETSKRTCWRRTSYCTGTMCTMYGKRALQRFHLLVELCLSFSYNLAF